MIELRRRYGSSAGGGQPSRLPAGYQEVEYLESTGTQYLITDIPANDGTDVEVDFQFTTYIAGSVLFGSYKIIGTTPRRWYFFWRQEYEWNFGHGEDKLVAIDTPYDRHIAKYITSQERCVKIDGKIVKEFKAGVSTNSNIYIFWCNNYTQGINFPCCAKIFSLKAKTADKEFNLIPCYRTSDREAGMYDIVNDVFYVNQGTGEFLVGPDVGVNTILPTEYQQVEYLQGDGKGAYIDTMVQYSHRISIDVVFEHSRIETFKFVFGLSDGNYDQFAVSGRWNSTTTNYCRAFSVSGTNYLEFDKMIGTRYRINMSTFRMQVEYDDVIKHVDALDNHPGGIIGVTIPLFCLYSKVTLSLSDFSTDRIFSCIFFDNDIAIRNFIPCYRKADNVAGMYDIVNGVFHTNAGTGEFIVGPDVIG